MRFLLVAMTVFFSVQAFAGGGTGVGVVLGSPNGVTARHWIDDQQSIEGSAGWAITKSRFQLNTNYLWNQPGMVLIGDEKIDLFFGLGLSLRSKSGTADNEVVFGPRLPVGLAYEFANPDIELFTQAAVNVGLIPSSDIYFDANIGVRFYF
ncbi:MAG: hypothetical protein AB7K68_10120 [Bacteriovoracia bacterium]